MKNSNFDHKDKYKEQLLKAMDDMEHNIENGAIVSSIERIKPYSDYFNYNLIKLQNLIDNEIYKDRI